MALDRLLNKDWVLQVLSVLLALVLWVQATAVQNPEDRFTFNAIPVLADKVPDGVVVTGSPRPSKVNITVRCRRRVGEKLSAASFAASVLLDDGRVGSYDYPVGVSVPAGVELVEISPASVSVTLERTASAKVPVTTRLAGASPEGYSASEPTVTPGMVTAKGPASVVSRVAEAVAEVDISTATADTSATVPLAALDANGNLLKGVTFTPAEVAVSVTVVALPAAESVDVAPVLTGSPAPGYAVLGFTSNPDRVSVRPKPGRTIDFDRVKTQPVDISGSTSDVEAVAALVVPDGVYSLKPAEVQVTVKIGASRSFLAVPVVIRNVPEGYVVSVSPLQVDIVVRGPRSLLDQLSAGDLTAWVDAAGHGIGSVPARINVDFPAWTEGKLEVFTITPSEATLTVGR